MTRCTPSRPLWRPPTAAPPGADLAAVMPTITVEGVTGTMTWSADGNTNKAASAILYKNGVGTLFGQDNANDAAGAESGDAADTAADAEA